MFKSAVVLVAVAGSIMAQPQPVFRSGTRLIQVDVVVQNSKGLVRGLTKDDFTVLDKGKAQNIAVFSVTDTEAAAKPVAALPAGVASNRMTSEGQAASAITVILFDRINTTFSYQAQARKQILGILSTLKPTDRVAFYSLGARLVRVYPFTKTAEALVRAAKTVNSQGDSAPAAAAGQADPDQALAALLRDSLGAFTQNIDNATRVKSTTSTFQLITRTLDGIPGRKNLVWMTASIPFTYGVGAERRDNDEQEFNRMVRILSDANVALYPVDPRGGAASGDTVSRTGIEATNGGGGGGRLGTASGAISAGAVNTLAGSDGMRKMADETGGKAFYQTNDVSGAAREVLNSAELTYTLGFYADEKSLDGKVHELLVKLNKQAAGSTVFHRKSYLAIPPAVVAQQIPTMNDLINEDTDEAGINIMAAAAPDPNKPGNHVIQIRVMMNDIQFDHKGDHWFGSFDMGLGIDGKVMVKPMNLDFTEEQMKQVMVQGLIVDSAVPSPDKPTQLRVVIEDKARGAAGSVRIPIGPGPAAEAAPAPAPAK